MTVDDDVHHRVPEHQRADEQVETRSVAARCMIVGVAYAPMVSCELRARISATSAMTTNWSPINAAPDEPTMT